MGFSQVALALCWSEQLKHVFVFLLCKWSEYDSPETRRADVCGNEVSFLYSYFPDYSHIVRLLCMPEERFC